MSYVRPFLRRAGRKRPLTTEDTGSSEGEGQSAGLQKCLTTFDLVSLGVGSCCGAGMYLTTGLVSQDTGFGAVLSFTLAGFGSMLSGLCYAELSAMCPRTSGSAYMYSYVTVGELVAFVIGWGLIVEYAIGTAAAAVALSAAVDTISNNSYSALMENLIGGFVGRPYFDVIALVVCLALTLVLCTGVKLSAGFNNLMNFINMLVLIGFFVCAMILADKEVAKANGPFPRGISAAIAAIPTAYYAYVGFDIVATTGEEAKDPSRSIPRSIWVSVLVNTIIYVVVAVCLNSVVPFTNIDPNSAMIHMLSSARWPSATFLVAIGAVCALLAATFGSLFPLPRVLYAMAKDGLMLKQFGYICPNRKTPKTAIIVSGCVTAIVSVCVDLRILIELVLIGTLLSYILVAVCVILLRYTFETKHSEKPRDFQADDTVVSDENVPVLRDDGNIWTKLWRIFREVPSKEETFTGEEFCAILGVMLFAEVACSFLIVMSQTTDVSQYVRNILYSFLTPFLVIIVSVMILFSRLPQNTNTPGFRIPCVPLLPVCVTFFNMYLMISLSWITWCMFGAWMLIGLVLYIYFSHRKEVIENERMPMLHGSDNDVDS